MRAAIAALFALAVAATILSGGGLVLVPHAHPAGTPPEHPHGLALYRFPIALLGDPPGTVQRSTADGVPAFRLAAPIAELVVGISILILSAAALMLVPSTPRARRLAPGGTRVGPQWWSPTPTTPPRAPILRPS